MIDSLDYFSPNYHLFFEINLVFVFLVLFKLKLFKGLILTKTKFQLFFSEQNLEIFCRLFSALSLEIISSSRRSHVSLFNLRIISNLIDFDGNRQKIKSIIRFACSVRRVDTVQQSIIEVKFRIRNFWYCCRLMLATYIKII